MSLIIVTLLPERAQLVAQIEDETAGKAELGLALRLFGLIDFEVLHEPAMQTKVSPSSFQERE